jgi:hypothetical protein
MSADTPRQSYAPSDVLDPAEVRAALAIKSDSKWDDVKARIPWSDQLGRRTLRISWGRLLTWLESSEKRVA